MEYTKQEKYWIWLGSIPEVTPKAFYYILKEFGNAVAFYDAVNQSSKALEKISRKVQDAAKAACSKQYLAERICELETKRIRAVTRLSDEYPEQLTHISYPPPILYVKGSLGGIGETFAIVGTRRCTRRGADFTKNLAKGLGQNGMTVVSGMALGIDTAAHSGAMAANSKTVAVLGSGADVIYPLGNEEIYEYAVKNGAIVSELRPGTKPYYTNFPARNRIITGLCKGILIVESEMEGGTAISAAAAISQGRDIFAVPGIPGTMMSALPNALIAQGAIPVTSEADILEYYEYNLDKNTNNAGGTARKIEIQLDFLQRQIYNLLLQGDMSVENIASSIEYPQSEINVTLTMMELAGLIKRLPGGKYGIE